LAALGIRSGEAVLVASGATIHAVTGMGGMPQLPGALIVPTVGGQQEPDPSFQTNETVRRLADRTGAQPRFLSAPALTRPARRPLPRAHQPHLGGASAGAGPRGGGR